MQKHMNLKLDRKLIDPNFNGYKLSLDSMPIYQHSLEEDVDIVQLLEEQYSYQHLKAFGVHNHLFVDSWTSEDVWLVDKQWRVHKAGMSRESNRPSKTQCYTIPEAANRRLSPGRVNVTISFTSCERVVLCDGTGWLHLLSTGDRTLAANWKECYSGQPLGSEAQFSVLHSVEYTRERIQYIDAVCVHVERNVENSAADDKAPNFITKLEWLTFISDNSMSFTLSRTRTLQCGVCPEYLAIDSTGSGLVLTCEKSVRFVYDSLKPVIKPCEANGTNGSSENNVSAYTWTQKEGELTVRFEFSEPVAKSDLSVMLQTNNVDVRLGSGDNMKVLLSGSTVAALDTDNSTWTLLDGKLLELNLFKSTPERWSNVVVGDSNGEEILDTEKLALINEQLSAYTSETMNPRTDDEKRLKTFNTQQLEECDAMPDEDLCIYCFHGESHELIYQTNISGNQWLFSAEAPNAGELPIVCLRHDVDGIIWQPAINNNSTVSSTEQNLSVDWHHVATFNAFGYVQASKQQKRFTVSAQDFSYVALADSVRHIYIYKQPEQIISPIRNRKTGESVGAVAKQQLISLDSTENIVGVRATRKRLFAVSGKTLYCIAVYE